MKALVLHGPGNLRFESKWKTPEVLDGWVLVRVKYSGICGSDLPRIFKTGGYSHPLICGHEFCGNVDISRSKLFNEGDRVAVLPLMPCGNCELCKINEPFHCKNYDFIGSRRDGGFAEYCVVPEENLFRLPGNVDFEIGVFIEPILVSLHILRTSGIKSSDKVLVLGAGTIGILVARWAKLLGVSKVFITDIREEALKTARQCQLKTLDARTNHIEEFGAYDVIIEAAGANSALVSALEHVNHKGKVVVIGIETGDTTIPNETFKLFMRKEATIIGCWGYKIKGEERFLSEILSKNLIDTNPLITHRINLEDGAEVLSKMWNKTSNYCKVIIDPTGERYEQKDESCFSCKPGQPSHN